LNPENILLVLTNMPDDASAKTLAQTLIEQKLAACVNLLSPCQSVYTWQGKVEHTEEVPLMIKTDQAHYDALEAAVIKAHPYELPEIISINVNGGFPRYLQWVSEQLST